MFNRLIAQFPTEKIDIPKTNLTPSTLHTVLQLFFGVLAAVALLVIVLAGLRITIGGSNPQVVSKMRNAILYAVIGLVIAMSAFTIVTFVIDKI